MSDNPVIVRASGTSGEPTVKVQSVEECGGEANCARQGRRFAQWAYDNLAGGWVNSLIQEVLALRSGDSGLCKISILLRDRIISPGDIAEYVGRKTEVRQVYVKNWDEE